MTITLTISTPLHGRRLWRRCGSRQHVTLDGRAIVLVAWQSDCTVCGAPITIEAAEGAVTIERCAKFRKSTCPRHRMTTAQTLPLRYAAPEQRRLLFERLRVDMLEADQGR
jgi:hypothetical protein